MQTMIPLEPGGYYHIYNRGINGENLFREERNYQYFINLYRKHISPVAKTIAYCLLRNHFHILLQIREGMKTESDLPSDSVSHAFNNFFVAYAKGFNKTYERTGALFQHHFHRIPVTSDRYLIGLVQYIHTNPIKHGFVKDIHDWPFSSFHAWSMHDLEASKMLSRNVVNKIKGTASWRKRFGEKDERAIVGFLIDETDSV
jgi:putative transposase